jgi:hypothetical protein
VDYTGIVALVCVFIIAPTIVFGFILLGKRGKNKLEELRYRRDILALELEKDKSRIALLEAESRNYDRLISEEERK